MFDYRELLTGLQRQVAPEAHIAGGAVRDTILRKPVHDIDVFMADEHLEDAAALLRSAYKFVKTGEGKGAADKAAV
jgi:tRNA nucleotidyltransferase/poly(A) polymerase